MSLLAPFLLAALWAAPLAGVEEHAAPLSHIIFPLINFLIFFYLVRRFLLPLIKDRLSSRRREIVAQLEEVAEAKERAGALLKEYQARVAGLDEEARKIKEELHQAGEREKSRLIEEAESRARKIMADARFLGEQEVKAARQKLRAEMASVARGAAAEILRRHLNPADQERLAEGFLREVR